MSYNEPARTTAPRTRATILAALVVVGAAPVGVLAYQSLASSSFSATSPLEFPDGDGVPAFTGVEPDQPPFEDRPRLGDHERGHRRPPSMSLGEGDGAVLGRVTVFDDEVPAVAKLDPPLLSALRRAADDAARDEVEIFVESGWRSSEYQAQLLRAAVSEYGSEKVAARWVATPERSAHVSGDAIDIGPDDARVWLSEHGAVYGLCQIYRNEPWHYELRPTAIAQGCPRMYADPTHDPRMKPS